MTLSVFDLFKVGIGPSSSHTVGPMKAARLFALDIEATPHLPQVARLQMELFGSLGLTGRGHGSDKAVQLGLCGDLPETVDPDTVDARLEDIASQRQLLLLGRHPISFNPKTDIKFRRKALPLHPNGMVYTALDADRKPLLQRTYFSVGGGFVVDDSGETAEVDTTDTQAGLPYPFHSGDELLRITKEHGLSISDVVLANETVERPESLVRHDLLALWNVMRACVERGCRTKGTLPGGLNVPRRAPKLYTDLSRSAGMTGDDPLRIMDWVSLFALAVNEENAAGGRVVTAPTNGAAGIVPAVVHYYEMFRHGADEDGVVRFLLTAGAIGMLFKRNASISGAEVGCQGEVGVACAMAAGGLAEALGGTPAQVENAAEIGMEHNLGLTCDPIGGLVQIPCIERNAMGAIKAINAARLALQGDGSHFVSLDKVIKTMRDTGRDMRQKYKETSRGGLAVNVIEC